MSHVFEVVVIERRPVSALDSSSPEMEESIIFEGRTLAADEAAAILWAGHRIEAATTAGKGQIFNPRYVEVKVRPFR